MSISTYLKETVLELKQVNWPSRNQAVNFTVVVIALSLLSAVLLGVFDLVFVSLLKLII
ncbi:MAG: preprotein translocase subunit SecE [Patescibacteria group bacterium]